MTPQQMALQRKKGKEPTTIVIIRHGEKRLNKEKRMRGWSDIPLAKDKKTTNTIKRTARELDGKLDYLVSSDLERAEETAKIISKDKGFYWASWRNYESISSWHERDTRHMPAPC